MPALKKQNLIANILNVQDKSTVSTVLNGSVLYIYL